MKRTSKKLLALCLSGGLLFSALGGCIPQAVMYVAMSLASGAFNKALNDALDEAAANP